MSKYKAIRTEVDGIMFASKKEAKRYGELKLLEKAGEIGSLELQPTYAINHNGIKICSYRADFAYTAKKTYVVEDVKGMKTPVYNLKKKLMRAFHGIEIKEV